MMPAVLMSPVNDTIELNVEFFSRRCAVCQTRCFIFMAISVSKWINTTYQSLVSNITIITVAR